MSGVKINNIVKRSISLSPLVNKWAEEMAAERGFGTNFSAFVADLVRRAQDGQAVNFAQQIGDRAVADAISEAAATPATGPVSYRSKPKAARRKATPPATDSRNKAL